MSQLRVTFPADGDFYLNVLTFTSPVFGEMNSAQTKHQIQYFPIKVLQPEIRFEVIFPNEKTYEQFQKCVRTNQVNAQSDTNPGVTLNWPERNIKDYTGLITGFKAGGMRRNYTPRAQFVVELVDSMVSSKFTMSSISPSMITGLGSIFGGGGGAIDTVASIGTLIPGLLIGGG